MARRRTTDEGGGTKKREFETAKWNALGAFGKAIEPIRRVQAQLNPTAVAGAEEAGYNAYENLLRSYKPTTVSGGGAASQKARVNQRYANVLQKMLAQGKYGTAAGALLSEQEKANQELMNLLGGMETQGRTQIQSSADALAAMLSGQQNPYANFQAQTAQATPELQQLLQSQGASTDPLAQYAAAIQSANAGQQSAFQNMVQNLANTWQAGQTQRIGDVAAQRQAALDALTNQAAIQGLAAQQQIAGQRAEAAASKEADRMRILEALLQAMGQGARVRNIGRLI